MAALTLAAILAVLALPPYSQPQAYHNFADQRELFGVPHFLNVVSNAVFVLVGATGLWFILAAPGRPKWPDAGVTAQSWQRSPYRFSSSAYCSPASVPLGSTGRRIPAD